VRAAGFISLGSQSSVTPVSNQDEEKGQGYYG
jgi:hypothetical protein